MGPLQLLAKFILGRTPLGRWPIRARIGFVAGARWTLYPWTSYWRGTHEPELQAALCGLGGGDIRGWNCWDLGAHFGFYGIGLARRVGPTGQVAAFEPNPVSFARLEHHRAMNHLPWLKLYPAAVSAQSGSAELYTYGNLATTTTHLPYDGEQRTVETGALTVHTVRLDDLVRTGELRAPNFVKIDVEGHGHQALQGMQETLSAVRPLIVAGFHSPQEIEGMTSLLLQSGYRWEQIGSSAPSPKFQVGADYLFTPGTPPTRA